MALKLKNEKMVPALSLDKVHISSWLQTEETEAPYKLSIQAKVILYGHDQNGERVYDPDGFKYIDIKDWRTTLTSILGASDPATQAELLRLQDSYLTAMAYIVSQNTDIGDVEL